MADRAAGRRIICFALILWAKESLVAKGMKSGPLTAGHFGNAGAEDVCGVEIDFGHLLPDQASEAVFDELAPFLDSVSFT